MVTLERRTPNFAEILLGKVKLLAGRQVSRTKQPAAQSRLDGVGCEASGRLLCLSIDRLLMANKKRKQFWLRIAADLRASVSQTIMSPAN
jgi:hypothetical protein